MATIAIRDINAFDATISKDVTFAYSGEQLNKNRIVIYNNTNSAIVYDNTVSSYSRVHTIPANTLINGNSYYCTITAYYTVSSVEQSITSSSSMVFMCLSTPIWGFSGISNGAVIGNSYYDFVLNFDQPQGETVDEYKIILYSSSGSVFWSSDILYDTVSPVRVTGLVNGSTYYIRAYGTTTHGMVLDTRIKTTEISFVDIAVNINYITPNTYALAYLENNKWQGYVKLTTNVASIEGRSITENPVLFIDGKYANLSSPGAGVIFDENFHIGEDFTLQFQLRNITPNSPVLVLGSNLSIYFRRGVFDIGEKFFASLSITGFDYTIQSNLLTIPTQQDEIYLWIQFKNGLYDLIIANKGVI